MRILFRAGFPVAFPDVYGQLQDYYWPNDQQKLVTTYYEKMKPETRLIFEIVMFRVQVEAFRKDPGYPFKFFRPVKYEHFKLAFAKIHNIPDLDGQPRLLYNVKREYKRYEELKLAQREELEVTGHCAFKIFRARRY